MTNNIPRDPSNDRHIWLRKADLDRQTILLNPIYYMVDPRLGYDPRAETRMKENGYVENVFCKSANGAEFSLSEACDQHAALREKIIDLGGSIILGHGRAGQFDGVFTRDAGFCAMDIKKMSDARHIEVVKMTTMTANFFHYKRMEQGETDDFMAAISFFYNHMQEDFKNCPSISFQMEQLYPNEYVGEFGDFMYVPQKNIFIAGHKPAGATDPKEGRTDKKFHDIVAEKFGMRGRILPIEVANGFYHADTSSEHLPNGSVLTFEHGMNKVSFGHLVQLADGKENMLLTSEEDANHYACNPLQLWKTEVINQGKAGSPYSLNITVEDTIMPAEVSKKLVRETERISKTKVHTVPMSQFVKHSGGGPNCLTNRINNFMNRDVDYTLPTFES